MEKKRTDGAWTLNGQLIKQMIKIVIIGAIFYLLCQN